MLLKTGGRRLGWAGTRLLFGPEIAVGATAIAALHPQFLLAAITVNSDALVNVWGAFVWWQTARVVTGQRRGVSILLVLTGAVAALLTKRIGVVLVGIAAVVTVVSICANPMWRLTRRDAVVKGIIGGLVATAVLVAAGLVFEAQLETLLYIWRDAFTVRRPLAEATLSEAFRFVRMTIDYSWLIAGWLKFPPPEWWLWVARVLVAGGIAGAAVVLVESRAVRPRLSIAWLFVAAQVVVMLGVVFWTVRTAPQARYLFPVFAPITVLLYVGLQRVVPRALHRAWPAILVGILALMDVTGFTTVLIPAYVR